jgi:hypothetical protein
VYDVFMTLLPRHWSIRPRDVGPENGWGSDIDPRYIKICECKEAPKKDEKGRETDQYKGYRNPTDKCDDGAGDPEECHCDDGIPDDCCGPDVGILNLRQRLVGPLPYIVDPALFPDIICCLTNERLSQASEQLAAAHADLDAASVEVELTKKKIADKIGGIESNFRAELSYPIDCTQYQPKEPPKKDPPPTRVPEGGYGDHKPTDQTAR